MADGEPSWLKTGASSSAAPATASESISSSSTPGNEPQFKTAVKITFFIINLGLMVLMAYTGSQGIAQSKSINDTGAIFVGIYMILFAGILAFQELSVVIPFAPFLDFMKRNVGFLFGVIGKGMYILFMGILTFGLSQPYQLALATAIVVSAWGPIFIGIYLMAPRYFDVVEKFSP